ncbi:MAG: hypothetical protein WCJ30_03275 [Deltaproteobacteria bacterium]
MGPRVPLMLACLTAALLLRGAPAWADEPGECEAPFVGWLAACEARSGVALRVDHCADGVAVVRAQAEGESVRVQISRSARGAFAQVGHFGLQPVAQYPDWAQAPPGVRRGFEALRACTVAREPPLLRTAASVGEAVTQPAQWRTWLAIAVLAAWLGLLCASARRGTRAAEGALAIAGAALVALVRHVAVTPAFFHQNGQGPGWIQLALCQPSTYGPGYAGLFHLAALAGGAHAERGVFALQEALAGLSAVAVYASARGLALSRRASLAMLFATGVIPLVARLARSESYYAAALWLLALAMAALLAPGPLARPRAPVTWASALVAGVLLALAVTVHPVAWVPAACIPALTLLRAGSRRSRAIVVLGSAMIVGATVAALALGDVRAVLHGTLGRQWGGSVPGHAKQASLVLTLAMPWIVGLALPWRLARWIVPGLLVLLAVRCDALINFLPTESAHAPTEGWHMLFRVTALGAVVAYAVRAERLLGRFTRHGATLVTAAVGFVGLTYAGLTLARWTALPTDALEAQALATELAALPESARVHYLGRSGLMLQELPCYTRCGMPGPVVVMHDTTEPPPQLAPGEYWLRAAPCATTRGRPFCDAVERGLVLRTRARHRWPARPSLPYEPYDGPWVDTALSLVESAR